jgi:hypothetical protein
MPIHVYMQVMFVPRGSHRTSLYAFLFVEPCSSNKFDRFMAPTIGVRYTKFIVKWFPMINYYANYV